MVGARGFEPPTPDTPCQCATRLRYAPIIGILGSTPFPAPIRRERKGVRGWSQRIESTCINI